jgi:hypothetical protein
MNIVKNITLSILLIGIAIAAFRLSFDAQVKLAVGSGIDSTLAFLYPLIIDAAILAGVLLRVWYPNATKEVAGYLWGAVALWTVTSVLGNAFHVLVLPDGSVTLPPAVAVGVNTMPALTLFLVVHLATKVAFPPPAPSRAAAGKTRQLKHAPAPAPVRQVPSTTRIPTATRSAVPSDEYLLGLAEEQKLTVREIAKRPEVAKSPSWVSEHINRAREARGMGSSTAVAASPEHAVLHAVR